MSPVWLGMWNEVTVAGKTTIPELLSFLTVKAAQGLRPRSLAWYEHILVPVLRDLGPTPTTDQIVSWLVAWRIRSNPHPSYYKARMIALSAYFRWQGRSLGLKLPSVPRRDGRRLSDGEVGRLLGSCKGPGANTGRDRAILALFLDSGLRLSELAELRWVDVDLEQGRIAVEGKGGHARTVYFGETAGEALRLWANQNGSGPYLFPGQGNRHLRAESIAKIVSRRGREVGLKVSPHDLRRTFATSWVRGGGNVFQLQRLLGHSTLEMVRRYVSLAEGDLAAEGRKGILDGISAVSP